MTTAFIVFFGRSGPSEIERRLDSIKIAIGAVVLARAGAAGFAPLIAVTADAEARAAFARGGADVVAARSEPFHFGQELLDLALGLVDGPRKEGVPVLPGEVGREPGDSAQVKTAITQHRQELFRGSGQRQSFTR